ncbi:hypothetical protein B0F87_102138 [Methylobacter tundripaludum]|uniref:Uncharacterized protein n=1 Tax=Methylobacter tundripaludum TaxID=173365 RepID=A0A2S6HHS2_9GAMM|nr:hypothetical protein B0F87_102138 [Methylobacter tundripaludum]
MPRTAVLKEKGRYGYNVLAQEGAFFAFRLLPFSIQLNHFHRTVFLNFGHVAFGFVDKLYSNQHR